MGERVNHQAVAGGLGFGIRQLQAPTRVRDILAQTLTRTYFEKMETIKERHLHKKQNLPGVRCQTKPGI
jgi:hypothetical protein